MDATRTRRTKDQARQDWYARHRQWRFARFLGLAGPAPVPIPIPVAISRIAWTTPRA